MREVYSGSFVKDNARNKKVKHRRKYPLPLNVALSDYCDQNWDNCIEFLKDQ